MKTKLALLFTLMAVFNHAFCTGKDDSREKKKEKKTFKHIYIGVSATPSLSYRYLHGSFVPAGNSQENIQGIIDYSNKHSVPELGVNVAAKVGINVTHWLAIESGVGYSLIRYRYNSDQFYTPSIWNGNNYVPADSFKTRDKETYHYLTIPIGLRFSIGHRKVRGIIAAGAELDFLLQQRADYTYTYANGITQSSTIIQQTHNFNTFNVSPYLGIGMDCYLSPAVVLRVMPQAQIQGLKNTNTPITEYLWNAGLNISFLFGL